MNDIIVPD